MWWTIKVHSGKTGIRKDTGYEIQDIRKWPLDFIVNILIIIIYDIYDMFIRSCNNKIIKNTTFGLFPLCTSNYLTGWQILPF